MKILYAPYGYVATEKLKACLAYVAEPGLGPESQAIATLLSSFLYIFVVNVYGRIVVTDLGGT